MAQSPRDQNFIPTVLLESSTNPGTVLSAKGDQVTGRLLTDSASSGGGLTVGTTTISGGTTTRILYDNTGVLGEYTLTGTGTVVVMQTAPTFVTSITTPSVLATANDSGALGASGTAFSDVFLASGAVVNFNAGNMTITHAAGSLTFAGGNILGLGATTATTFNGLTITANGTNTLNITAGKTLAVTQSLTLSGTDSTIMTFPTTTATIARTDAGQTFTGINNLTSPDITTSVTTTSVSFTAFAGATTLLTIGGTGASASLFAPSTLDTSSSVTGAIRTSGGISAAKSANIGTTLTVGTGYQIGGAAASGKILIGNGTNFVASTPTFPNAAGTTGNILTSDGTNFVSSAPTSGAVTKFVFSTIFETAGRFGSDISGGTITFGSATGVALTTTSTTTRYAQLPLTVNGMNVFAGNPTFSFSFIYTTKPTTGSSFFGIGDPAVAGTGITYGNEHIGFKLVTSASTTQLVATQGSGSTELASSNLTTLTTNDFVELIVVVTSGTSATYYYRVNNGSLSAGTTLSGTMPASTSATFMSAAVSNNSTATTNAVTVNSYSYTR